MIVYKDTARLSCFTLGEKILNRSSRLAMSWFGSGILRVTKKEIETEVGAALAAPASADSAR